MADVDTSLLNISELSKFGNLLELHVRTGLGISSPLKLTTLISRSATMSVTTSLAMFMRDMNGKPKLKRLSII